MDKNIRVTGCDIGDPPAELADPISFHPPWASALKRVHLGAGGQTKPITFVPHAVEAMSSF